MREPRRHGWPAAALVVLLLSLSAVPAARADPPVWKLEQPPPPAGAVFRVPVGAPGDMQCYQRNRCLLMNEGNATVAQGIFVWNGAEWHQLSTVCGGPSGVARVAFSGPDEFWTVTDPSLPRTGPGQALCHIANHRVVGSFSTALQSADPYRLMDSASCFGPNDCWFGGPGAIDAAGTRKGAFHVHWDGSQLSTVYGIDGRGVTDIQSIGGAFWEGVVQGKAANDTDDNADPVGNSMLHRIVGGAIAPDPFAASPGPGSPPEGADILALDSNGTDLWAAGGFTASGTSARPDVPPHRGPLIMRYVAGAWQELHLDPTLFGPDDRFVDVASVPGTTDAWVAVQAYSERGATNAPARVALVHADGTAALTTLPTSGSGRGTAAKIEFSAPNDGWLVTNAGWVFHFIDANTPPVDDDPSFQGTITFRPNEAAAQFVPDKPPPDDSQLLAPPVTTTQQSNASGTDTGPTTRLPAALKKVKSSLIGRSKLLLKFVVVRPVNVRLLGYRKRKLVAKTKAKTFTKPGNGKLVMRVNPRRFPTKLTLQVKETTTPGGETGGGTGGSSSGSGETVTT